jgi:serine/threonine protein kinase
MGSHDQVDPLLGRLIAGKLEVLELLGSGAMGKVFRAHHVALDKPVAIKVLQKMSGAEHQHALRFKAEARAASRLDHPNSVQILDFGEDEKDGLLYIAMEFLEGEDLQSVLAKHRRLEGQRVAWIMAQVCAALGAAHQKGVIHRDMKPGNIMLIKKASEDGAISDFVKVCDFGLAKILDTSGEDSSSGPLTKQGAIFGTPAYMSPEQARGEPLDSRTDLYSVGCVMYKMLVGSTPFQSESATGVLMKHITEPPVPISKLVPSVDRKLEAVVMRAMEKDKNARFPDARSMRNELRRLLHDYGVDVPSLSASGFSPSLLGAGPGDLSGPEMTPEPALHAPVSREGSGVATVTDDRPAGARSARGLDDTLPGRGPNASGDAPGIETHRESRTLRRVPAPLPRSPSEAHTFQTLPPPERTAPPPATVPRMIPWLAALIPGSIALVGVGALCVYVLLGPNRGGRDPGTTVPIERSAPEAARRDTAKGLGASAVSPQSGALSPDDEPERALEASRREIGESGDRAAPPPPGSGHDSRGARSRPGRGAPPRTPTERARSPAASAEDTRTAEKIVEIKEPESVAGAAKSGEIKPASPEARETRPPEPQPVEASAAEARPAEPAKLGPGFKLSLAIEPTRVDGGVSKGRSKDALDRHRSAAEACVRSAVQKIGVETSGTIEVKATIDVRGKLKGMGVSGALAGVDICLSEAFANARLPAPDTGEATIVFQLKYRTNP